MTGIAKKTDMRLLVEVGAVCSAYQDRVFRDLNCKRIQVDECWAFSYAKAKNVTPEIAAKNPMQATLGPGLRNKCVNQGGYCRIGQRLYGDSERSVRFK
jgi:hypothetical protein